MDDEKKIMQQHKAYFCLDCGKCTGVCPVSKYDSKFSPRRIVEKAVYEGWEELVKDPITWECLTCNMCSLRCPADVHFIDFIQRLRVDALPAGNEGKCTHGETIHSWMKAMAETDMEQDRLSYLGGGLEYGEEGEYLYFTGCLPHYQAYFGDWGLEMDTIARSTIGVLNSFGIKPAVMRDEVCCGHDPLWAGDTETFTRLLEKNVKAIEKTGAKKIIVSCAECLRTLSVDYPGFADGFNFEVVHLAQFLGEKLETVAEKTGVMTTGKKEGDRDGSVKVTYHDPCRMSKHLDILDPPRAVLESVGGVELVEMPHSGVRSLCCGTSLWMACGEVSKKIQIERLTEASGTGAEYLITACPKCQIHLRCAQREMGVQELDKIPMIDFATFINNQISGKIEVPAEKVGT